MVSEIFLEKVIKHELTLRCLTFQLLRKIFRCLCRSLRASGVPVTRTKIWTPQLQFDRKQQKNFDKLLISWEDHIGTAYSSLAAFKLRGLSTLLRKLAQSSPLQKGWWSIKEKPVIVSPLEPIQQCFLLLYLSAHGVIPLGLFQINSLLSRFFFR